MQSKETTTTNITRTYLKLLKRLSASFGMSQIKFLENCIYYFKTTGINPEMMDQFSPKEEINKLSKRVDSAIAFFQKHEKDKLNPLLDNIIIANRQLQKTIEYSVSREDLQDEIEKLQKKFNEIDIRISLVAHNQKESYNKFKRDVKYLQSVELKTHKLISILFEAVTSKGFKGVKEETIKQFNKLMLDNAVYKI